MEMKASLDPVNRFLSSWTSDADPCSGSFEGVHCNEHRKVANITLQGKGLSGKVPPAVAGLKCLSGLYLHYNSLSGEIPREISSLTELSDLYLDFNNLSGAIPPEIGNMASLQVLQLCSNQLTGAIPSEIGFLKKLSVVSLQKNNLTGKIPPSLGNLGMLRMLNLSFNRLSGTIPANLAQAPALEFLDVRNNSLWGIVPSGLKKLKEGFQHANNSAGLCGVGFSSLRVCSYWDGMNINQSETFPATNNNFTPTIYPVSSNFRPHCNQTHCPNVSKFPRIVLVSGVTTVTVTLSAVGLLTFLCYRRRKQKIGSSFDTSEGQLSTDRSIDCHRKIASPLVSLEYSTGWDPLADGRNGSVFSQEFCQNPRFNLDEIESATQYFSEVNLLGKSKFWSVYKGILRDGSLVAIRSISATSCKSEEADFLKGLNLLSSLRHENLVRLRGFCCSKGRGECYLIHDFVPNGSLSRYLDLEEGSSQVLNWSTRVSIIHGIAKGIGYLHSSEENKPSLIHRSISADKVLIDQRFNPLISESGLPKLLADDIVFSALKTSAALGYLAPEYITTGSFTEKSDIYAFGVIILQILSGKQQLTNSMRLAAESCRFADFVDTNLKGEFSESEAAKLAKIGLACTHELPDNRPIMETVIQELST